MKNKNELVATCANCWFWRQDGTQNSDYLTSKQKSDYLTCKRHPPVVKDRQKISRFLGDNVMQPCTHKTDWCGEWKEAAP